MASTHDTAPGVAGQQEQATAELVGQLGEQLSRLARAELRLAQLELKRKGKRQALGGGLAAAAAVMALFACGALIAGAVAGLALAVPVWVSALIVAAALLVVASVLALLARKQIARGAPPIPEQAVAGARRDIETIKGSARR